VTIGNSAAVITQTKMKTTPICHAPVSVTEKVATDYSYEWPNAILSARWSVVNHAGFPLAAWLEWKAQGDVGSITVPVKPKFYGLVFAALDSGDKMPDGFAMT
jgi:hypothetical protein